MEAHLDIDLTRVIVRLERTVSDIIADRSPPIVKAHQDVGDEYLVFTGRRYRDASAGDGTWKQLAPSTVREKGRPLPILVESGDLLRSLKRGGLQNVFQKIPHGIRTGTGVRYGKRHQRGDTKLPKRSFLVPPNFISLQTMRRIYSKAFTQAVEAGLRSR